MQQQIDLYLESHKRVLNWTKELEFLGYLLLEIVDPHGLEERGFYCHQAADLPAIVDTLRCACYQPDSRLRGVLDKKDSKYFGGLLLRSKQIRNVMAHHIALSEERMLILQETKQELDLQLQSVISRAALKYNIQQVNWYPDDIESSGTAEHRAGIIALDSEPLLYQRQQILGIAAGRSTRSKKKKRKRNATEESRAEHWRAFETSLRRKLDRMQKEKAQITEGKARKLQKLEQEYRRRRQVRLNQINRILRMMEDEDRDQKAQRSMIIGELSGANISMDALFLLILLAVSSPFWLLGLGIRRIGLWGMRYLRLGRD